MPTEATLRAASIAALAVLLAAPVVLAEERAAEPPAAADTRDVKRDPSAPVDQPVDVPLQEPGEPQGGLPKGQRPGEPQAPVDDETSGGDEAEQTTSFGTFFLTTVSFASAFDRLSFDESAPPPLPIPVPPGSPPVTPPQALPPTLSEDGEIAYLVRPSFLFVRRPDARGGLVVAYEPEIETLQDDNGDQRISHSAGVTWDRRTSRRTDLTAGGSYIDSADPTRHLGGEGFVLVPGRFQQSRAYFGASHLWNRATRVHFYSELASATSAIERLASELDVADWSGTLALEQGVGRGSNVSLSYSYTQTEIDNLVLVGTDTTVLPSTLEGPSDAVRLGFGHAADAISFSISAGALREQTVGGQDDISWIGGFQIARDREPLRFSLSYDHSLFAFGYGTAVEPGAVGPLVSGVTLADTKADTVSFDIAYEPQGRLRFEQSVWLSRESVIADDEFNSFVSSSLVEVAVTGQSVHRLILFSSLDYFDRERSSFLGGALSRTRFTLGARIGLTGPQTKTGQRLADAELERVLPSGGRL